MHLLTDTGLVLGFVWVSFLGVLQKSLFLFTFWTKGILFLCALANQRPEGREMFIVAASYLSLLQVVAVRCSLPYVSLVSGVAEDGTPVYGIEVEVPSMENIYAHCFFLGTF